MQYGSHAMADRYTYMPLIGIFIIAAWGIPDLLRRWEHRRVACAVAGVAAIAAYAIVTTRQLRHWQDSVSLFQYTLSVTPQQRGGRGASGCGVGGAGAASTRAGATSRQRKRTTREAEEQHYARVLRSDPASTDAHIKLGRLLADGGIPPARWRSYREAIRLESRHWPRRTTTWR